MNYLGEDGLGCPQRTAGRGMGGGMARVFQTEETHRGLEVRVAGTFEAKKVVVTKGQRGEAG